MNTQMAFIRYCACIISALMALVFFARGIVLESNACIFGGVLLAVNALVHFAGNE